MSSTSKLLLSDPSQIHQFLQARQKNQQNPPTDQLGAAFKYLKKWSYAAGGDAATNGNLNAKGKEKEVLGADKAKGKLAEGYRPVEGEYHWYCNLTPNPHPYDPSTSTFGSPPPSNAVASSSKTATLAININDSSPLNPAPVLITEIATYLIYFFAYNRNGIADEWMTLLEGLISSPAGGAVKAEDPGGGGSGGEGNGVGRRWRGCKGCSRGFMVAREKFGKLYINQFPEQVRAGFHAAVDKWQADIILARLQGLRKKAATNPASTTLLNLPGTELQLLLGRSGDGVIGREGVRAELEEAIRRRPLEAVPSLVSMGITPGLLHLLANGFADASAEEDKSIRDWADVQVRACRAVPLGLAEWGTMGFESVWRDMIDLDGLRSGKTGVKPELGSAIPMTPAREQTIMRWLAVWKVLESGAVGKETVEKGMMKRLTGNKQLLLSVAGCLASDDPVFPLMVKVFGAVLHNCATSAVWTSTDPSSEFPIAVGGDIMNNPLYIKLLDVVYTPETFEPVVDLPMQEMKRLANILGLIERPQPSRANPLVVDRRKDWTLSWMLDYLVSLRDYDVEAVKAKDAKADATITFNEGLARCARWCFEGMQHRRFSEPLRANIFRWGIKLLYDAFIDLGPSRSSIDRKLQSGMLNALEIHAGTITAVAFNEKEYTPGPIWDDVRQMAIHFLYKVFMADGDNVRRFLTVEGKQAITARKAKSAGSADFFPVMKFAEQLWKKVYATSTSRDVHGITLLMRGMIRFSHLPTPRGNAWGYTDLLFWKKEGKWERSITSVTEAMKVIKGGFGDKLNKFAAVSDPNAIKALFDTHRVPDAIVRLLLCSDTDVHEAIIGLIQGIFNDVDERIDCFRAMLLHYPTQTMTALIEYLQRWVEDAQDLPTAVESARWLVRCFTDILEVLCRQSGAGNALAFLRDATFLGTQAKDGSMTIYIARLWTYMTKALAVILERTQRWAPFYDNAEMVDWMQDAIIFGRLLIEESRTFEAAAAGTAVSGRESPMLESPAGKAAANSDVRLLRQLEQVLSSLTSWLRITEPETLHQTYELMKSLLTRLIKTIEGKTPSPSLLKTFATVDGFCRRAKGHRTKLSDADLGELADIIRPFMPEDDSGDEVEYLSTSLVPSTSTSDGNRAKITSTERKDAFSALMAKTGKSGLASDPAPAPLTSPDVISVDDFDDEFDDGLLDGLGSDQLDMAERAALDKAARRKMEEAHGFKLGLGIRKTAPVKKPIVQPRPAPKIQVAIKPVAPGNRSTGLLGKIRREVAVDARNKPVIPKLPTARPRPVPDISERRSPPRVRAASVTTSESESDGEDTRLSALKHKSPAKAAAAPVASKARVLAARKPEMSAAERQRMNAHRMRMRLKPDMSGLWARILKWDPSKPQHKEPNLPPKVPMRFATVKEHVSVFETLFFQELHDQSMAEITEYQDPVLVNVEVASRQFTDDFIDMELSIVGRAPDNWWVTEADTVLLSAGTDMVMAKVQAFKRMMKNVTLHIRIHGSRDSPAFGTRARCSIRKHMSMSTAMREYAALKGLPYYEEKMLEAILEGRPTPLPEVSEATWQKAMVAYDVNEPQAKAIVGALRTEGFALIQGPPGTGKTKTISGLAGRFMSERPTSIAIAGSGKAVNAKLLICAPSNAAIDEVTRRLMNGIRNSAGQVIKPRIVRLGAESSMSASVKAVSLDSLVETQVSLVKDKGGEQTDQVAKIEMALDDIRRQREAKQNELAQLDGNDERRQAIEAELSSLQQQRMTKSKEIGKLRDAARDSGRQLDAARREARQKVLEDADIICSTLAGAGHDSISAFHFPTVIIDEAAQSVEPSALVPLKYGCSRCILIGDPQQLPPTVISTKAESLGYNQSLFVRMVEGHPNAMHLLSIQYRMHPDISQLPSEVFYGGKLHDGPNMAALTRAPWHGSEVFGTYRFYDIAGAETKAGRQSLKNVAEVNAAMSLYRGLRNLYGDSDALFGKIGVIAPYKEQLNEMKRQFRMAFGESAFDDIDFGTIDGMQGQEKAIIILSTVRSGNAIGFLRDYRRMNVALTRAKSSLFVLGSAGTLERLDEKWRIIVGNARHRGFLTKYENGMFVNPPKAAIQRPAPAGVPILRPGPSMQQSSTETMTTKHHGQKRARSPNMADEDGLDSEEAARRKRQKKKDREKARKERSREGQDEPNGSTGGPLTGGAHVGAGMADGDGKKRKAGESVDDGQEREPKKRPPVGSAAHPALDARDKVSARHNPTGVPVPYKPTGNIGATMGPHIGNGNGRPLPPPISNGGGARPAGIPMRPPSSMPTAYSGPARQAMPPPPPPGPPPPRPRPPASKQDVASSLFLGKKKKKYE